MTPILKKQFKRYMSERRAIEPRDKKLWDWFWNNLACYEVSEIIGPVMETHRGQTAIEALREIKQPFILPGPVVAYEFYNQEYKERVAYILFQDPGFDEVTALLGHEEMEGFVRLGSLHLPKEFERQIPNSYGEPVTVQAGRWAWAMEKEIADDPDKLTDAQNYMARAMILSEVIANPDLVQGEKCEVHRGLAKKAIGSVGISIKPVTIIHINKRSVRSYSPSGKDEYTPRCLHFVRAHKRRLANKTTIVSAHWRGDPTLGTKEPQYKVKF